MFLNVDLWLKDLAIFDLNKFCSNQMFIQVISQRRGIEDLNQHMRMLGFSNVQNDVLFKNQCVSTEDAGDLWESSCRNIVSLHGAELLSKKQNLWIRSKTSVSITRWLLYLLTDMKDLGI